MNLQLKSIAPVSNQRARRSFEVTNGLLLRRDIHSLFDRGYVTVRPEWRFEVSRQIKEEFENGRDYYTMHGRDVEVPTDIGRQPNRRMLTWHSENRYLG
jgi:putative restriction endonuclease